MNEPVESNEPLLVDNDLLDFLYVDGEDDVDEEVAIKLWFGTSFSRDKWLKLNKT